MLSFHARRGLRSRVARILHYRYTAFWIFLILMMYKLVLFDDRLRLTQIKLDQADYVIAVGSLLLVSFWTLWLPLRQGSSP